MTLKQRLSNELEKIETDNAENSKEFEKMMCSWHYELLNIFELIQEKELYFENKSTRAKSRNGYVIGGYCETAIIYDGKSIYEINPENDEIIKKLSFDEFLKNEYCSMQTVKSGFEFVRDFHKNIITPQRERINKQRKFIFENDKSIISG